MSFSVSPGAAPWLSPSSHVRLDKSAMLRCVHRGQWQRPGLPVGVRGGACKNATFTVEAI